jgi:hypothetical protein
VRVGAISLLLAAAMIPLSAVSVSADPNFDNPGHHYGWLKHHVPPPPPPPPPVPAPPPPVTTPPPTTTTPPPTTTTPPPATTTPPAATTQPQAASAPASAFGQNAGTIASAMPPATEIKPVVPPEVKIVRAIPQRDPLWWLLLVLVAALAVLWLFVTVQLARAALKRPAAQVS